MKFKNTFFIQLLLILALTLSCDDDDPKPLCIEEPCGTVMDDQTNLTLLNLSQSAITDAAIIVNDESQLLSTEGWDFEAEKSFSCWQTVPRISPESTVIFQYVLEGEVIVGVLNAVAANSTTLVIEIDGDNSVLKSFVACIDVQ